MSKFESYSIKDFKAHLEAFSNECNLERNRGFVSIPHYSLSDAEVESRTVHITLDDAKNAIFGDLCLKNSDCNSYKNHILIFDEEISKLDNVPLQTLSLTGSSLGNHIYVCSNELNESIYDYKILFKEQHTFSDLMAGNTHMTHEEFEIFKNIIYCSEKYVEEEKISNEELEMIGSPSFLKACILPIMREEENLCFDFDGNGYGFIVCSESAAEILREYLPNIPFVNHDEYIDFLQAPEEERKSIGKFLEERERNIDVSNAEEQGLG